MITTQNSTIISSHGTTEVRLDSATRHHSLHARVSFCTGDVIALFHAANIQRQASFLTIQLGPDQHITLKPDCLQFVNHSCSPNTFFDTATMQFISLQEVSAGEELCFFYPSTEWDMAQPFQCMCRSSNCLHEIRGAAHLPVDVLCRYRLTPFIINQLNTKSIAV